MQPVTDELTMLTLLHASADAHVMLRYVSRPLITCYCNTCMLHGRTDWLPGHTPWLVVVNVATAVNSWKGVHVGAPGPGYSCAWCNRVFD
jgi:hypothetical protein